mgnify:CR=1 FL=1
MAVVVGLDELLQRLDMVDAELSGKGDLVDDGLLAAAEVVEADALQRVPVRTGQLRNSIYVANSKSALTKPRQTRARPGTAKVAAADYKAHLVEYGTRYTRAQPFLRVALDNRDDAAKQAFVKVVERGLGL